MKLGRRGKIAATVAVVATAAGLASFGPLVRSRAGAAAARLGGTLEIASVRPRWNGVSLHGVTVRLEDVPSATIRLDEVEVEGLVGASRVAAARGGAIDVLGPPSVVAGQLITLRDRLAARSGSRAEEGGRPATRISAEGLELRWSPTTGSSEAIVATGLRVDPGDGGRLEVGADTLEVTLAGARVGAAGVELAFERSGGGLRVAIVGAREATLERTARPDHSPEPPPGGVATLPATSGGGTVATASRWRAIAEEAAAVLDARFVPEPRIVVDALSAKLRVNGDVVSVGPGRFELRREPGPPRRLVVQIAQTSGEGEAKTLALRIAAPHGEGAAAAPLAVEVHGGPIPLAALGLREGDLGLVEPERAWLEAEASVEIDDAAGVVRFDGDGRMRGLSVRHPALSDQPIRAIDVGFRGKVQASLDGTSLRASRGELELGALRVLADGEVRRRPGAAGRPEDWNVDLRWEVPLVACQSLLDGAPTGLLPLVAGSTMAGSLALKGTARFDTAQLDRSYEARWDAAVGCRMVAPRPQVAVERFLKPFKKSIYTPEGALREAEFGPGTPDWTPGSRITHVMGTAVITSEDGRFERHGGFDHEAIRNSIRENLRSRKFVRGASTISMQLAKNLYLPRDKTLSRKLEEAVLTLYLEQVLTKEQLMELYLNVVEFGPMIYGIGPAAQHYFRTSPGALTVSQCFYLASILPSPKRQHFAAGGAVTGSWMNHLRRLMKHAHKRGRLNDSELDEGLTEVPVFGSSAPIREAPEEPPGGEGEGDVPRREPWADGEGDG